MTKLAAASTGFVFQETRNVHRALQAVGGPLPLMIDRRRRRRAPRQPASGIRVSGPVPVARTVRVADPPGPTRTLRALSESESDSVCDSVFESITISEYEAAS